MLVDEQGVDKVNRGQFAQILIGKRLGFHVEFVQLFQGL